MESLDLAISGMTEDRLKTIIARARREWHGVEVDAVIVILAERLEKVQTEAARLRAGIQECEGDGGCRASKVLK